MANLNIKFNNKNFSIDPASLADATARLEAHLRSMMDEPDAPEERLEGDGAEFYTLAPTALSFRSTAPLNELNEVQINGVTVDPANYTLTEGSTIVTFPIEYLKTLDIGNYEVTVASESKTVKGGFNVKAPELNEYGFYYNQPYANYMDYFTSDVVMFIREDSTMDIMVIAAGATETVPYTVSEGVLTIISPSMGELHCTFSANGMEINNVELGATLSLSDNTAYVADNDYFYIYKEDLGGYEVSAIDKTKAEYGAIKTGINGAGTVKLADCMFSSGEGNVGNTNMTTAPNIPNTVTTIGKAAFYGCLNLKTITIPDSISIIDTGAFVGCPLEDIYITDAIKWMQISFGDLTTCLYGRASRLHILDSEETEVNPLIIPSNITNISDSVFCGCIDLISVVIHDGVTSIEGSAFDGCTGLTSVTIGDGVKSIGDYAFCRCSSLTNITIPNSVTSIGAMVFGNCHSLTSVEIGDGVTSIDTTAFSGCKGLTRLIVSEGNSVYKSINGDLYAVDEKTFISCVVGANSTNMIIPDSVENVGDYAFSGCTSLTSVVIPDSVTSIGSSAFSRCKGLTSVTIGIGVTSIDKYAFFWNKALRNITFNGTTAQWNTITKGTYWNDSVPATHVHCSDGQVAL